MKEVSLKSGQVITIKELSLDNLSEMLELQQLVIASLLDKSLLQPLSKEEFTLILKGRGMIFGAFHDNELIAFRAMLEPEIDDEHLGIDAGLVESELSSVLYSEISNVSPEYRGNGLQHILGQLLFEQVDTSRYRYICATVAPFNIASLKDKFALGMHIVSLQKKYGEMLRYTFVKDLTQSTKTASAEMKTDMGNTHEQQDHLGKGFIGTGLEEVAGKWVVNYQKKL
ncbi:N-acetyltransferase [Sporosarcina quadrami]